MSRVCILLLFIAVPVGYVFAQSTSGTIAGEVRDPQAAVIPGASITITNLERGQKFTTKSDPSGNYLVYPVPEGTYQVVVEAGGFQKKIVDGVYVDVDSRVRVDLDLTVAKAGQTVTILAAAPEIQRDSAVMESVIENQQILDLPLDGRNILNLAYLGAGADQNLTNAGLGDFASNGNRPWGNTFLVDGVSSRDEVRGQSGFSVSVDAVQEFKLKNSNASAEYGGAGTQMSVVVKSGTNQIHGSAFEFNRSTVAQSRNFFSRTDQLPPFLRNQFGGSIGGPIRHNKTFFFFNYEGQLLTQPEQGLYSIPTPAMAQGNFVGVHNSSGQLMTLATPTLLPWTPVAGEPIYTATNVINPFYLANSTQNPNRINAEFAEAMLGYYQPPTGPGDVNNFTAARPTTTNGPQFTARVDHQLTAGNTLTIRSTVSLVNAATGTQAAYQLTANDPMDANNGVASLTSVIRPTLISEFRFGWNNLNYNTTVTPKRNLISELGIEMPLQLPSSPYTDRIPTLTFTGNGAFFGMGYQPNIGGDAAPDIGNDGDYSFSETVTWQKGKHQIKAGYQINFIPFSSPYIGYPAGLLTYTGRTATNSTGYSAADLLLGLPASSSLTLPPPIPNDRTTEQAAFLQTDWRIHPRLTLNIGLRWEVRPPPTEANGQLSAFDPAIGKIVVADPGGKVDPNAYPQLLSTYGSLIVTASQAGWNPSRLLATNWLNMGPRFGFAYSLDQHSGFVLRGGFGMFYSYIPDFGNYNSIAIPFGASSSTTSSAANLLSNADPFRLGVAAKPAFTAWEQGLHDATNMQWNLTLERLLFRHTTLSVAYVGNGGYHLLGEQQINPGDTVYPQFGGINEFLSDYNSIYNAMQTELRQRYSNGLSYQFNWTWAKSIDDMGGALGNAAENSAVSSLTRSANRANSDFVQRHVVRGNVLWQMPFGSAGGPGASWHPVLKAILGKWSIGSLAQWTTGLFATPSVLGSTFSGRPNLVPGISWRLTGAERQTLAQQTGQSDWLDPSLTWYNPLAFATVNVDAGVVGNAGRNTIVGPDQFDVDAVLSKHFHIPGLPERVNGTVRIEAFNLFNHVNFFARSLDLNVNTAGAGAFSTITGNARQMQFGFRMDF